MNSATEVVVTEVVPSDETGGTYTGEVVQLAPTTAQNTFITGTRHSVSAIASNSELTLAADITNGFAGTIDSVDYRITSDLTRSEEASFLAGYSTALGNRRLINVWPDTCAVTVGGIDTLLPGFYFCCAVCALTAGLPSQQGFTNLSLTGFSGRANSDDRFTDTQLDTIAGGGTLILAQDVVSAPVYIRHQLTTNTSTIQFQELSITKNLDLVARFFRNLYAPYIGHYNVTDTLLDILKTISQSGIEFLKNSKVPRAGGVLREGVVDLLAEDVSQPDSVLIIIDVNLPYPLNNIKVTLLV